MVTRQAIILRGIAGSGKSTLAEVLASSARKRGQNQSIVSSDSYRYIDGEYIYGPETALCHDMALRQWVTVCVAGVDVVIYDAINPTSDLWWPLAVLAHAYGYRVDLVTIDCAIERAVRSKHGLTVAELERQFREHGLGNGEITAGKDSVSWLREHRWTADVDLDEAVREILPD